jgi:NAD(P)-dependent dehydrogenase (short-subunit alcohol dehydrogenase family)
MKRMVTPAEVANAVTFLATPAASGITGIDLVVDGSPLANLYILDTRED